MALVDRDRILVVSAQRTRLGFLGGAESASHFAICRKVNRIGNSCRRAARGGAVRGPRVDRGCGRRSPLGVARRPASRFAALPLRSSPLGAGRLLAAPGRSQSPPMDVIGETLFAGSAAVKTVGLHIFLDIAKWWNADDAFFEGLRDREVLTALFAKVGGAEVAADNAKEKGATSTSSIRSQSGPGSLLQVSVDRHGSVTLPLRRATI